MFAALENKGSTPGDIRDTSDAPIRRLPKDVLKQIVRAVHALEDDWGYEWYRLLWVSRSWRAVVHDCPDLWNNITIKKEFSQGFLGASLTYSKDSPIDVSINGTTPTQNAAIVPLLLPHSARIRTLHARGMLSADDSALQDLLSQAMPILHDISVNITTKTRPMGPYEIDEMIRIPGLHEPEDPFVWDLHAEQFPALRKLYLGTGLALKGSLPVFPGLKGLELFECSPGSVTIAEFANFLAQLPELEELCIYRFRPIIAQDQARLALPPSLRKLSLEDNAYYTRPFLSAFDIPVHLDLKAVRLRDYEDFGDFPIDDPCDPPAVKDMLPADTSVLPIIKASTSLELRHYFMSSYSLRGTTRAGHTARLTVKLPETWPREYRGLSSFNDALDVFGDAFVDTLFLNGNDATVIDWEDWDAALNAWPSLERITIAHTDSLTKFDARLSLLEALLPPELAEGEAMEDAIPVPWLKKLTITSTAFYQEDAELAEELASCLKARMEAGFPLKKLHIKLEYIARPEAEHEVEGDNKKRVQVYTKALKKLVKHLKLEPLNTFYPENYVMDDD